MKVTAGTRPVLSVRRRSGCASRSPNARLLVLGAHQSADALLQRLGGAISAPHPAATEPMVRGLSALCTSSPSTRWRSQVSLAPAQLCRCKPHLPWCGRVRAAHTPTRNHRRRVRCAMQLPCAPARAHRLITLTTKTTETMLSCGSARSNLQRGVGTTPRRVPSASVISQAITPRPYVATTTTADAWRAGWARGLMRQSAPCARQHCKYALLFCELPDLRCTTDSGGLWLVLVWSLVFETSCSSYLQSIFLAYCTERARSATARQRRSVGVGGRARDRDVTDVNPPRREM
jgi:hypothetical protein